MKCAIYGMPCSGKSTLLAKLSCLEVVQGSVWLAKASEKQYGKRFRDLLAAEQDQLRKAFIASLAKKDNIIVDGHYAFGDHVVFTEEDGACYDVFFYLYEDPQVLASRMRESNKNQKYLSYDLSSWQRNEINALREFCHRTEKDFYVIDHRDFALEFIDDVCHGYSCVEMAKRVVNQICDKLSERDRLYLVDGDRTFSRFDMSKHALKYQTNLFDGNFYTGFQFWLQAKEFARLGDFKLTANDIALNETLLQMIDVSSTVLLTCGHPEIWRSVSKVAGVSICASGPEMSADTKYHIAAMLKKTGRFVEIVAHGDSFCDWYMLQETKGCIWIKDRLSRSFSNQKLEGLEKRYLPIVLNIEQPSNELTELCNQSKSNSGLTGNQLAEVHERIGELIGERIAKTYDPREITLVALMRGGMFFARGIFRKLNCRFQLFDPQRSTVDDLDVPTRIVILADSVINTGERLLKICESLHNRDVIVAAGVIQSESLCKFSRVPLYVFRASTNRFVGARCKTQKGLIGPDTSDRLFNYI